MMTTMSEHIKSVFILLQHYFYSLCHFISFNLKRLGSIIHEEESLNDRDENRGFHRDRKQMILSSSKDKLKPSSDIPGPKSFPVIGTLLEFNKFGPRYVHELSVERHREFGDIFREKLFNQELIFVGSPELLKQWMTQEGKLPSSLKQEPSVIFNEVYPDLRRGLFFRNGEEWYNLRKLGHNIVHKNAADFESEGLFESCEVFVEDFMQDIQEKVVNRNGGVMNDLEDRCYSVVLGCNMRIVYGPFSPVTFNKYTGTDLTTLGIYAKEVNICCQRLLEGPARLAKWFGSKAWTEYSTKLRHNLTSTIKYGREKRKEILKNPESASLRTHGLLYKASLINTASWDDVDDLLSDFAIDSKDPFSGTVMFFTQVLAACPDVQEKIFEEISQVYQSNEKITYGKLKYLEYTKGFYKEVVRLYPVAAFSARVALEETVLGSFKVSPGAMIMYSSYAAQRNPKYFSEPLKVLPERWLHHLEEDEEKKKKLPTCDQNAFAGFGINQRLCLGQNLAISIGLLYLANLVRKFRLAIDDGMPEVWMRTVLYPKEPNRPIHFTAR